MRPFQQAFKLLPDQNYSYILHSGFLRKISFKHKVRQLKTLQKPLQSDRALWIFQQKNDKINDLFKKNLAHIFLDFPFFLSHIYIYILDLIKFT